MKKILLTAILAITGAAFAQPSNDECSGAIEIPVNAGIVCDLSMPGTTTGATASAWPSCAENPVHDVWYKFTALSAKHYLHSSLPPGVNNIRQTLYSGSCGNLTMMKCHLASNNNFTELANLTPGQVYYIRTYDYSASTPTTTFSLCINTNTSISTATNYTAQQLVQDVLTDSPCMVISNVTSGGGTATQQSMGYFSKNNSAFPLNEGIILSTGAVAFAEGPNTSIQSFGENVANWGGDSDLTDIMPTVPGTTNNNFYNATKLEFDFVPMIDHISFDYLFASEEYGQYQCDFADAFAFILTDMVTGIKTNLAVVPNSNAPVSVVTIRNSQNNTACASANEQFFGEYFQYNNLLAPVNFNGITVPMTAKSEVIPGRQYHIKLVIADRRDALYDSAVFIDGGSFNIGSIDDGYTQLTSSNGAVLCNGSSTVLSINGPTTLTYSWYADGSVIPGATGTSLTVDDAGTYTVRMAIPGNSGCFVEHTITLHSATSATAPEIADIWVYEPNSDNAAPFNLAAQATAITSQTGYANMVVTFHLTLADAQAGVAALITPYVNTANPQTIYVRVQNPGNGCFVVSTFDIGAVDENYETPPPTGATTQGFQPGDTLGDIEIDGDNIQWYDNPGSDATGGLAPDSVDVPLALSTLLVDGMTYYASQTRFGRESADRLPVTIDSALNAEQLSFRNFSFRPNPVKDVLQLTNGQAIDKVEVYNIVGQIVKTERPGSASSAIDMSSLNSGVYIVKITAANAGKTLKIVKQ
ncbi:MAG: choice-of-anchor L domain-containing protein [Flavobacterium sp.]